MIRVLLVDDAEAVRLLIRLILEADGRFEVVGDAADGEQAIELLETHKPDAVVLDIAMPKLDGLEVLTQMKARGIHSKVLAFSGFNGAVEDQARALGVDDYLHKGASSIEELVPRLAGLFA